MTIVYGIKRDWNAPSTQSATAWRNSEFRPYAKGGGQVGHHNSGLSLSCSSHETSNGQNYGE